MKRTILMIGVLATMVLASCAPRAATPATSGGQTDAAKAAPAAAASKPTVLTLVNPTTFPDIDPSTSFSNDSAVTSNVYETLLRYNPPGSKEVLSPQLATKWEPSNSGKTWTFTLREGVKFHDGTPFNAAAVKFSVERTQNLKGGAAFIWDAVSEIKVKNDLTVVFELKYPAALDLVASAGYAAWMISPKAADKDGKWFNTGNDAGTGPYTIEKYEPGQRVILTRFKDYWGGWKTGQFDKVVLESVEDTTVRQQKIENGEADWTYDVPTENLAKLDEKPDVKVVTIPAFQNLVGLMNTQKGPLKDAKVRRALSYSFPYDTFIKTAIGGYATQSKGPIPVGMFGHAADLKPYAYDLDKAKALLKEAGFEKGGFELSVTYATGNTVEQQMGELWKAELAKLGITLNLKPMAWEAQWELGKGDASKAQDIFVMYWWPTYITPYDFLFTLFHSEEKPLFNLGYYRNPKYDEVIDKANEMLGTDKTAAAKSFGEAQKMLLDDAASVFFYDQSNIHIVREDLKGYVDNPAYPHIVFAYELSR